MEQIETDRMNTERMNPRVVGVAVAVMIASILGIGAIAGRIPQAGSQKPLEAQRPAAKPVKAVDPASRSDRAAATQHCATCGTVESVRAVEVKDGATAYRVTIRMDDGSFRAISQPIAPGYGVGEKVRVIDSSVVAHG